ncbi:MAG TPA: SusC/RagA family TonB-linked outer membrane protein, partial [Saprospiraceae bacterium]|nr:SusC/RagA family TonB-linked outer membrane protein [Saprospiraceae bacterium]
ANNRWGYFPSFSAGWTFTEDNILENVMDFGKVRASWGQNGNDNIGNYGYTSVVSTGQNYTFGPGQIITNGSVALGASNPDLKWETSTQTNIGLDMEFFNSRLQVITDYYIKKTSDMLYAIPVLSTAGTAPPTQNVATAVNKGFEFGVNYAGGAGSAIRYNIGGNITFINNEITNLGTGGEPINSGRIQSANSTVARTDVGHPLASFYGYVTDGLFQTQEEVTSAAFQNENTAPGDIRFKDLNGDNVIDVKDQTYIGNPIPKATYGLTGDISFMGFDLSMFWQGSQGNDIYNGSVRYDFSYVNRPNSALERWTGPGTSNFEPRVNLNDPNQNARVSDRFVEDGSYIRLKNLQLGYTFPKLWMNKAKIKEFRVYVSAQNLLTFTKYNGLDPEIGTIGGALELGIDKGFYPQARILLGGVSLKF